MAQKHTKWTENLPNSHKIYQHLSLQDPPKFTQIGSPGLKINHLATLGRARYKDSVSNFPLISFAPRSRKNPFV
jgi:hypothetical protein